MNNEMTACANVREAKEIPAGMSALEFNVTKLEEKIIELDDALQTAMAPPLSISADENPTRGFGSKLGGRINEISRRMYVLAEKVDSMLHRVQL